MLGNRWDANDFEVHDNCHCYPVPFFGDTGWTAQSTEFHNMWQGVASKEPDPLNAFRRYRESPRESIHPDLRRVNGLPSKRATELAERLRVPDGGFTVNPLTNAEPSRGFALATYPDEVWVGNAATTSANDVQAFVDHRIRLFVNDPNAHLGGWHDPDTGKSYLDMSEVLTSKSQAMAQAAATGELAIFDLSTFTSIPTSPAA